MASSRSRICKTCWQEMHLPIILRGAASAPFRLVGIRPSRMNPNTCTLCERMFSHIMQKRQIDVDLTVLFADLRGYTALSERLPAAEVTALVDAFYDTCAAAIWAHDGLLNKTAGDSVMALFNFPIRREAHVANALAAARAIREGFPVRRLPGPDNGAAPPIEVGVGIGLGSGEVRFGEFGHAHRDFTAIGPVINLAARAQSVAAAGQILATDAVRRRAADSFAGAVPQRHALKGIAEPVDLYPA